MVRSYLIENRIRFNSDSGSGGGGNEPERSNPREMAGREKSFIDNTYGGNTDDFISDVAAGVYQQTAAEERAAAVAQAEQRNRNTEPVESQPASTVLGGGTDDMGSGNPITDLTAQVVMGGGSYAGNQSRGGRGPRPLAGLTREQQRDLEQRDDMVARNIIAAQTQQPSGIPTTDLAGFFADDAGRIGGYNSLGPDLPFFGQTQVYTGRPELDPNNFMSVDEQLFYDQRNGADEPLVRALQARQEEAPIDEAPPVSDDLAVNYLQNPFYAYSGFGNQYNPYGYATGTLVDLLQTRNMTQPGQADTMGLFGNPRDFT